MNPACAARCFVCGARALRATERTLRYAGGEARRFALACQSCGVLLDDETAGGDARREADRALGKARFRADPRAPYGLDIYTLRILAAARRRLVRPAGDAQARALREPHAALAADAWLSDPEPPPFAPVTLALLCRAAEAEGALKASAAHLAWTDDVLVLVDGEAPGDPGSGVRVLARPLGNDFAAQRNAAQEAARHPWVLQLDADETLEPALAASLGWLAANSDPTLRSVGFPRRNLVDGVLSDLYPDTQYRLNRRDVRYAGTVHERPVLRHWRESTIAATGATGAIRHHLSRAHVEARSARYEAMAPGEGRLFETRRLLEPFRP